jgi:hypothetical protein
MRSSAMYRAYSEQFERGENLNMNQQRVIVRARLQLHVLTSKLQLRKLSHNIMMMLPLDVVSLQTMVSV